MPRPYGTLTWERNRHTARGDLIPPKTLAAGSGFWQLVDGIWPLSIVVGGRFITLEADLLVSNDSGKPNDLDSDYPSAYHFTQAGIFTITQPFRWIKFEIMAVTVQDPTTDGVRASYCASAGSTD